MSKKIIITLLAVAFFVGAIGSVQAATGSALITQYGCLNCHGSIPTASTNAAQVALITNAINGGAMNGVTSLKTLTAADIQAIADYLVPAAPVACTSFTYSAWSACQSNNTQSRTVSSSSPTGCTGGSPVVTQSCTYVPPANACTSFTYSAWSACQSNNTQSRTVSSSSPTGCTGGSPVVTQSCNYVPPVSQTIPVPTSEQIFSFDAVVSPALNTDPALAEPIGVGPVALGGNTLDVKVNIGPFAGPVDVSLVIYAPAIVSDDLYFIGPDNKLKKLSDAITAEEQTLISTEQSQSSDNGDDSKEPAQAHQAITPMKKFSELILWKTNVTEVNESIYTGPTSDLEPGLYTLVFVAQSPYDDNNHYRWVTHFNIP